MYESSKISIDIEKSSTKTLLSDVNKKLEVIYFVVQFVYSKLVGAGNFKKGRPRPVFTSKLRNRREKW